MREQTEKQHCIAFSCFSGLNSSVFSVSLLCFYEDFRRLCLVSGVFGCVPRDHVCLTFEVVQADRKRR